MNRRRGFPRASVLGGLGFAKRDETAMLERQRLHGRRVKLLALASGTELRAFMRDHERGLPVAADGNPRDRVVLRESLRVGRKELGGGTPVLCNGVLLPVD